MRATAIVLACIVLAPLSFAALPGGGARPLPEGPAAGWFVLPAGHVLKGTFGEDGLTLTAEPAAPTLRDLLPLGYDCLNDRLSTIYEPSMRPLVKRTLPAARPDSHDPIKNENVASQGECETDAARHESAIASFQFYTEGDQHGSLLIEGDGGAYFLVTCWYKAAMTGVGAGWDGWTNVRGGLRNESPEAIVDLLAYDENNVCSVEVSKPGYHPNEYPFWFAMVTNGHRETGGKTYARIDVRETPRAA